MAALLILGPATLGATTAAGTTGNPHPHWNWGNPAWNEIDIFYNETMQLSPATLRTLGQCSAATYAAFNLESDGDQVRWGEPAINMNPADGGPPRADTVFQGTQAIRVQVFAPSTGLGALYLRWKPTHSDSFQPARCGAAIPFGGSFYIPVSADKADPAHQDARSGWGFEIYGASVRGLFGLRMTAVRGAASAPVGAAHPDQYGSGSSYDLGCVGGEVPAQVGPWAPGTPAYAEPTGPLAGIQLPPGSLVPLGTTRVEARLQADNALVVGTVELWYHAADSRSYVAATAGPPGTFVIADDSGRLADPPYEASSWWEFMLVPLVGVGAGAIVFEGSYELCATGYR